MRLVDSETPAQKCFTLGVVPAQSLHGYGFNITVDGEALPLLLGNNEHVQVGLTLLSLFIQKSQALRLVNQEEIEIGY